MSQETLRGIVLTLDLDDKSFLKKLNSVMRHISSFNSDLKKLNDALKLDPKNTELLASKTALLKEKQEETWRVANKLRSALDDAKAAGLDDANRKVIDLRTKLVQAEEELKKVNEELKRTTQFNQNLIALSENLDKIGKAAGNAAKALAPMSAASSALLVGAGKAAIDFESAFADVKKTIEETDTTSYDDLSADIVEMSKNLPTAATDIAHLVGLIGQLGVSADDAMKFAKVMVDLGNSTDISAEEAGTSIAQLYNLMGSDIDTVDRFASAIVHLGNNTATTESKIVTMAKYFGAAASTIGLTEKELLGISAALSSVGLETYGATSLSTIFRNIEVQVSTNGKKVKDWAKIVGMSVKDFKNAWQNDTITVIQKLFTALGSVEDKGGSLAATLSELGMENLRQLDTMTRLANASDLLSQTLELSDEAWEDGTYAVKEADKRYGTVESKLKTLKNRLTAMGIALSKTILPIVTKVVDKIAPMADKLAKWVEENQNLVLSMLSLGASVSPVLFGISGISKAATGVIKFITTLTPATAKLSLIMGGIAVGVTAVTATIGLLKDAMSDADPGLQQYISDNQAYFDTINEGLAEQSKEFDYYEKLLDEYNELVDASGKVKAGYEDRVNFIKSELVEAGLVEENTLGNVKKKQEEVTAAIYDTIEARRSAAYLEAADEQQKAALEEEAKLLDWLAENAEKYQNALKVVEQGRFPYGFDFEYDKALEMVKAYEEANAAFEKNNAIVENVNAMHAAYESGEWEEVVNLYNKGVYDLVGVGLEDVNEELKAEYDYLNTLKEQDDGSSLWQALIERTEQRFNDMVLSVGYSLAQIEAMWGRAQTAAEAIKGIETVLQGAGALASATIPKKMKSGGFASGGFTVNSTINVTTSGAITRNDVRSWGVTLADVINEELGKRL